MTEQLILTLVDTSPYTIIFIAVISLAVLSLVVNILHGGFRTKNIYTFKKDLKEISKKDESIKKKDIDSIYIGTNPNKKEIYLKAKNHIYVCGTTGSGKTVTLSNFIKHGIENNMPLLIVDGKGDTNENSILDIVTKLKKDRKVYVIDLNNPKVSDKYNPFANTSHTVVKDMLINMSDWSEEHYKANTERYLQRLVELLCRSNIKLSFKSIVENMSVDSFELLSARLLKEGIITKEEHISNLDLIKNSEKIIMGASARFSTIFESELGTIFDEDGIDIYTALNENAIILFILNPLIYPELSTSFGRLVTIDSKKSVSRLFENKIERGFFIFDEINVYASKNLLNLINKSRSANITCILASQSLSDLDDVDVNFKEQIIENCNSYIVMRQNSAHNAEQWASIIGTKPAMNVTYQIKGDKSGTSDTGLGSARITREYIYHPDEIKNLPRGVSFLISKDNNLKTKVNIHKPF